MLSSAVEFRGDGPPHLSPAGTRPNNTARMAAGLILVEQQLDFVRRSLRYPFTSNRAKLSEIEQASCCECCTEPDSLAPSLLQISAICSNVRRKCLCRGRIGRLRSRRWLGALERRRDRRCAVLRAHPGRVKELIVRQEALHCCWFTYDADDVLVLSQRQAQLALNPLRGPRIGCEDDDEDFPPWISCSSRFTHCAPTNRTSRSYHTSKPRRLSSRTKASHHAMSLWLWLTKTRCEGTTHPLPHSMRPLGPPPAHGLMTRYIA
jgi:hypothetical protein